jgi:hypothetical protein
MCLVNRPLRKIVILRFEVELSKSLLILSKVLPEDVPESLGLLRAEKNGLVVVDGDLIGRIAGGQTEDQLKVPYTDTDLDAVGVGFAVVGSFDEVHFGWLRS